MNSRSGWRAGAIAAGLFGSAALAAGCASSPTANVSTAVVTSSPSSGKTPQQQAAEAEHALVGAFASIPGAHVVDPASFQSVQASASWRLDEPPKTALATAAARLPHWTQVGVGADTGSSQGYGETVQTSGSGALARQSVTITVMPDGSGASTLQVNVEVDYRPVKPAAERIAAGAVLRVALVPTPEGTMTGTAPKVITSASTIAQIAAELNALPTMPRYGVYACPAMRGSMGLSLDFEPSANAPASASTVVQVPSLPAGACAPGVQVTIDGAVQPALDNSLHTGLFAQLEQLTGVR